MSGRPSPLKSATARSNGSGPAGSVIAGRNVPSPLPMSSERSLLPTLPVMMSSLPSPVTSARATGNGALADGDGLAGAERAVAVAEQDRDVRRAGRHAVGDDQVGYAVAGEVAGRQPVRPRAGRDVRRAGHRSSGRSPRRPSPAAGMCAMAMSGRPSPLKSAITGLPGWLPTGSTTWP